MLCLELEPTMNEPGLKKEISDDLGVSLGKEMSQLKAIWRRFH